MRALVLTYHAMNVSSNEYAGNDHIALREDLRVIATSGWQVLPLRNVVDAYLGHGTIPERTVALTFDDGADFDARDLVHPTLGPQRSMLGVLQDFQREHPNGQPRMHATSFVIVSPVARAALDRACMIGAGWWNDDWWQPALASGLFDIANHSWDHNHDALPAAGDRKRGTFFSIDHRAAADEQLIPAIAYLNSHAPNRSANLFAYPYGEVSEYLRQEYFPRADLNPGVRAAFSTKEGLVTPQSDRWDLPRSICGFHWKSPDALATLLRDAERVIF
jgi:peptidoglycan/xylan/chitin deacetylase (PgdA/CDA1 family)